MADLQYLQKPPREKSTPKDADSENDHLLKLKSKNMASKRIPPPFIDKESVFGKKSESVLKEPAFSRPEFIKPDIIAVKKKITLPPIDVEKINNPSYLSYYQIVREKIRRAAYQNYSRSEIGEVYLSFIISSDGSLKEVRLVEERSSAKIYLKEIALRSIKDASPFPNFPKALDYPQLSFNVIISFEIE